MSISGTSEIILLNSISSLVQFTTILSIKETYSTELSHESSNKGKIARKVHSPFLWEWASPHMNTFFAFCSLMGKLYHIATKPYIWISGSRKEEKKMENRGDMEE